MVPFLSSLPPAQLAFWPQLAPMKRLGFVLYGGTAVALRVGHRISVDFDFFSEKPLDLSALSKACGFMATANPVQNEDNALTVLIASGEGNIKISFFGTIGFGRVGQPETTDDGVVEVASTDDLLATKLKVLLQRVEAKDYRDIAALLGAGRRLEEGLSAARLMFAPTFQPSECLKALTYFEGGDLSELGLSERQTLIGAARNVRDLPDSRIVSRSLSV